MFLTSAALRTLGSDARRTWHWPTTSLLFVTWDWDCIDGSAEALAGYRLVAELRNAGASVHVLASTPAGNPRAHRLDDVTWVPAAGFSPTRHGRALEMIRSTVPETAGSWVAPAVRAGRQLLAKLPPHTIIYGRAMPGASNIVAWHLSRATGRPFVAHFSDEWPSVHLLPMNRKVLAPYKWPLFMFWRRRILSDAGALTFTNPLQSEYILGRWHAQQSRKAFVVAHLASNGTRPRTAPEPGVFHIVHTGNLYPPDHTAQTLMHGLRVFIDRMPGAEGVVRFTQAGWSNGDIPEWARRFCLEKVVRLAGRLSQEAVLRLLGEANLLVAIDYPRPRSTTLLSKTPDYLRAGRPLLAITSPASAMGRLFHDDGAGVIARHGSPEEVADRIAEIFAAWRNGSTDAFLPSQAAIDSLSPRQVLTELAAAFSTARAAVQADASSSAPQWQRERSTP